ncbi:hypothetical membrane protein (plasmid) [Xanthomonas albilineans]|uniref:Hypothetical membrane protein n=1 Tax=Xanthomonas albilineans (strain GPE PC73 / CFBP 7063) TaxID=380358 RepID=D6CKA5_XANAP|nr:hypothetical membrane protein [Xanthomonas albilineans]
MIGELVLVEPWQGMPDDYSNQKAGRSRSVFWWVGLLAFLAGPTALFASVVLKVSGTALLMLLYEIFFLLIVALLLFGIDGWLPHLNEEEEKQG